MVQIFGAVGEWILGNTFTCAVFFTYGKFLASSMQANQSNIAGGFWVVQGTNLMPFFATGIQYSPDGNWMDGLSTPGYNASLGTFPALLIRV